MPPYLFADLFIACANKKRAPLLILFPTLPECTYS